MKIIETNRVSKNNETEYWIHAYYELANILNETKCRLSGSPTHIEILKDIISERDNLKNGR